MRSIGFVGLGAMGMPMAENLLKKQFEVCGFDVRASAMQALEALGGTSAPDAAGAARNADALILMVVNAAQAEAVLFDAGALDGGTDSTRQRALRTREASGLTRSHAAAPSPTRPWRVGTRAPGGDPPLGVP